MWKITLFLYFFHSSVLFCSVSTLDLSNSNLNSTSSDELTSLISMITSVAATIDSRIRSDLGSLNTSQLIEYYSCFKSEEHTVNSNGYILKLFRIKNTGPSVLIFHGTFLTSDDWLSLANNSLPLYLASLGYDVWLANARGNYYSRKHVTLSPTDPKFWDFSWHEIGTEDNAACIDYICKTAGVSKITYIGHSQGTTTVFVLLSVKPEYKNKLLGAILLSPIAYIGHAESPLLQTLAKIRTELQAVLDLLHINELVPRRPPTSTITATCGSSKILSTICLTFLYTGFGFDYGQIDYNLTGVQFGHYPGGSSVRQLMHYLQNVNSNKFQMYDFGAAENVIKYGSIEAPEYEVEKITTNMSIIYGANDWFSNDKKDLPRLLSRLSIQPDVIKVRYEKWNHMDPAWAKDAKALMYETVKDLVAKYNS